MATRLAAICALALLAISTTACSPNADATADSAPGADSGPVRCRVALDSAPGADTAASPDAVAADSASSAPLTYADVQPLLAAKCGACHSADAYLVNFAADYSLMWASSKLCPGRNIGQCVLEALQAQQIEGSGCRTYVEPFHREGWVCLSPPEIALVASWVAQGMRDK